MALSMPYIQLSFLPQESITLVGHWPHMDPMWPRACGQIHARHLWRRGLYVCYLNQRIASASLQLQKSLLLSTSSLRELPPSFVGHHTFRHSPGKQQA